MSRDPVTGWEKLSALATLVQAVVVIISISYIQSQVDLQTEQLNLQTRQIAQQTAVEGAANIQALAFASIPMNLEEVRSGELTRLVREGSHGFNPRIRITEDDIKKERYRTLIATYLIFFENIYYQNSKDLIDPEMYAAWHKNLEEFIEEYRLKDLWNDMRGSYYESFRNHMDQLIGQAKDQNAGQP